MTDEVIDRAVLEELKEAAGAEFVAELVSTFLAEAPGMLSELRVALDRGDGTAVRRTAHSIKSNANVFGAHALAAPARDLELMDVTGATPEVEALLTRLDSEYARARDVLTELQGA